MNIEKHWCPTITSTAITGQSAFRFKDDTASDQLPILRELEILR